jgi:hypothetical protein
MFLTIFGDFFAKIAPNVPAVYDVLAARISKCVAFAGRTKCGGEKPHKGRSPTAVFRSPSPEGAKRKQTCYVPLCRTPLFYSYDFIM